MSTAIKAEAGVFTVGEHKFASEKGAKAFVAESKKKNRLNTIIDVVMKMCDGQSLAEKWDDLIYEACGKFDTLYVTDEQLLAAAIRIARDERNEH